MVGSSHKDELATAYGRKEGNFVAGTERGIPGGKFLVARGNDRGTELCEFGIFCGVEGEELLDGGGVGEIEGLFRVTGKIFETAEEEDFDADGLGDSGHDWIVTE